MTPRDLTVMIVSYNSLATIGDCLRSLRAQTVSGFRTLVVDSSTDGAGEYVRREFDWAEVIRSPRRLFPGAARNLGMSAVTSGLVAFLDADCTADPDWVQRILEHNGPSLIVGGSVDVRNPESLPGWALYFCEFSAWLPRGAVRRMNDIPTCNLCIRREAFDLFGPFAEGGYCSDTLFNWKASRAGVQPLFVPAARVHHYNLTSAARVFAKLRMHGEAFARMRAQFEGWSTPARKLRAIAWILLPPWLWLRNASRAARAPGYLGPFLRATPLILAGLSCWSWGEAVGYWADPAVSPAERRRAEEAA